MIRHVRTRVLLSLAILAGTGIVASLTTMASFTSSSSADHAVATGNVDVELGAPGTGANRLDIGFPGLAPGSSAQRTVDIANVGSLDLLTVALTTRATTSSTLDTDATNGLQLALDRCSTTWTESGTSPNYTYACSGTTSTVLASRPVIATSALLSGWSLSHGASPDHLRARVSLPSTAGNAFQANSSVLEFQFDAVQRSGRHL